MRLLALFVLLFLWPVSASAQVSVSSYGAIPNDGLDDRAAFVAAQNAGNYIVIPPGEYHFSSTLDISAGKTWYAQGATIKGLSPIILLRANGVNDWAIQGELTLRGSAVPGQYPTNANEVGLDILGGQFWRVEWLSVNYFKGWGVRVGGASYGTHRGETGTFRDLSLFGNLLGIEVGNNSQGAEYVLISGIQAVNNIHAVNIGAGNTTINGGNIVDNYNGIQLTPGVNDGHGIISAVNINHNSGDAIKATDITYGFTFNGVHVYSDPGVGAIRLTNSKGIRFTGGYIGAEIINSGSTGPNYVSGVGTQSPMQISGTDPSLVVVTNPMP